jgi:hypothetical protein
MKSVQAPTKFTKKRTHSVGALSCGIQRFKKGPNQEAKEESDEVARKVEEADPWCN